MKRKNEREKKRKRGNVWMVKNEERRKNKIKK